MRITKLGAAFLAAATLLLPVPLAPAEERSDAETTLREAGLFALGGIGVAGTMSQGERALREVLKKSDVSARLENLVSSASPAGQLYALLALRLRDHPAYERAMEKLRTRDAKVQTARGCMLQQESFRDLVKEIERGNYDTFLVREWPDPGR